MLGCSPNRRWCENTISLCYWILNYYYFAFFLPQINDRLVNLPYRHRDGKIFAYRGGQEVVVETDFGLTVTYDWQSQVTVSAPSSYANALCGLCGNYNEDVGDEMMMRNGQVTSNPDAFGHSWKEIDVPGCVELSKVECPMAAVALQHRGVLEKGCGILLEVDGPFRACRAQVDAAQYFQNCLHDFCLFPTQEDVMCRIVARYAAACQAAHVTVGRWRRDDFCGKSGDLVGFSFASGGVTSF